MARHTLNVTVTEDGRDKGKCFLLTEMPATQGEEWAYRALCALARSGVELPDDYANLGMAGIAALGFQALAGIRYEEAKPLLDEMMGCVQRIPDPAKPQIVRPLVEDDTEEILTRLKLRREVFKLHTDFFRNAATLISTSEKAATADSATT